MKKRYFYSYALLFLLLTVVVCLGFGQKVMAQEVGIKVSPVRIEELVDPGQILNLEIKVSNESDVEKIFYVYLRDFKAEGESGRPKLISPGSEEGYYLASWIDITREGLKFAPREEKTVPFTVNVPADIGPGGYFSAILFGTEPPRVQLDSEDKGAGMSIGQQTASLVLLQVKGEVDERAQIREFNTDKDFYNTPFTVNFLVRIENNGNVHIKPRGTITIVNMFNKEVGVVRVNENGGNILPNSIRHFSNISWEGKNYFGRYTATLGLTYGTSVQNKGQGMSSLLSVKSFWIIPWRIIIPVFLGLIFIASVLMLLLKLYKNKAIRKAMAQAGLGHVSYVKKYEGPSPAWHIGLILLVILVVLFLAIITIYFFFFA